MADIATVDQLDARGKRVLVRCRLQRSRGRRRLLRRYPHPRCAAHHRKAHQRRRSRHPHEPPRPSVGRGLRGEVHASPGRFAPLRAARPPCCVRLRHRRPRRPGQGRGPSGWSGAGAGEPPLRQAREEERSRVLPGARQARRGVRQRRVRHGAPRPCLHCRRRGALARLCRLPHAERGRHPHRHAR